ncbi:MAG: L-threonylcarbamoyladenylate synthase [Lachnospiraceae bacterium]|nr:L-threonylcarbamoyladenylate synthase [Lachnospiraceae bacterium]
METKVFVARDNYIKDEELKEASAVIRSGGLVAFPTETVYGLGGDATNPEASRKIYAAKGRPSDNPLIVHIADFSQLRNIVAEVPQEAEKLAEAFWPGPLTMILRKNDVIPYETTGGLDTVAIRMPSHPVARAFLQDSGCMIAAPSANTSGRPSPTTAQHVWGDLHGKIEILLDGGPVGIGIESTIVDLSEERPMILRPGFITQEMLSAVLGDVGVDPGLASENSKQPPKAPGMRYRHYAPKADLTLVEGTMEEVISKINALTREAQAMGKSVGVLATEENKDCYVADHVIVIGQRQDEAEIARHLFDVLRQFDDLQVDLIYSESFVAAGVGQAIMNRLLKAAGHKRIFV